MAAKQRNKKLLKDQKLDVSISNSMSTSGKLVTAAGYILLKAPNTTHKHYYTQHLQSRLPEATPYFNIVRYKKPPMDQIIPHLVVQCGEKHITPLCKGLLSILYGIGSALLLPRYVFSTMSQDQIKRHFKVHKSWSHSLKPFPLTPRISHLDQQRIEYLDDGGIIKCSTQEWAMSLALANGTSAHCDVVNGGSDRQATLVRPQTYFAQAQTEWRQDRSRLNPPSHREARFVENLSGLPDFRNIRIEIETNVSEQLSSAEIWQQAPPNVRAQPPANDGEAKKSPLGEPCSRLLF